MRFILKIISVTALLLTGCHGSRWLTEFELSEHTFDTEVMDRIRTDSGLNIPDGSRGLNFRYSPPIDPSFVARIEIPNVSRPDIVQQVESIQNEETTISGGPGEKVSWWPPPSGATIIDRQCDKPDGAYLRAAVTDEKGRTILYIYHAVF